MKKILFSLLLTVVFAVPAFSQMEDMPMKGHGEEPGQMMEMGNMEMMGGDMMCMADGKKMGLTDEQMAKMKPIHSEMQKKQLRSAAELKIAEIELKEIMEVKEFNLDKAAFAIKKIANMKTIQHLEMVKAMKDMRAVLTDEQFKNMHKMCMKMPEKKPEKTPEKIEEKKPVKVDEKKQVKKIVHKKVRKNPSPKQPSSDKDMENMKH